MKLLNYCNKIIEYSFYLLFFLVPLALTGDTSELFEFNKLWVTFILTLIVATAWTVKVIIKKELRIQKTPLDIPIILFVASQVLSTIFSLDTHVSLWGYYSRFNGGLFSILSYVFLYYAFVSNYKDAKEESKNEVKLFHVVIYLVGIFVFFFGNYIASLFVKNTVGSFIPYQMFVSLITVIASFAIFMKLSPGGMLKKSLYAILTSAVLVVLWGLPSRFGFDPTCLLFRGTLDVACWTADFQPKIRIFSTMGQPDWLAAYLTVTIPITFAIFINFIFGKKLLEKSKSFFSNTTLIFATGLFVFLSLSYLSLLYTLSRSAIIAIWVSLFLLLAYYFWFFLKPKFNKNNLSLDFKSAIGVLFIIVLITFFAGQPFGFLNKFTWSGISTYFTPKTLPTKTAPVAKPTTPAPVQELGGTDSGKIRLFVWQGAIDIWKNYPVFGSGLETYAFAYYKFRPVGHNLTSEWNFLYNKAHNEFLNYLATTGTVGILTYLFMIGMFVYLSLKYLFKNLKKPSSENLLVASLLTGYLGILITNFFGFSVVMINILFYMIPAFVFIQIGMINFEKSYAFVFAKGKNENYLSRPQIGLSIIATLLGLYLVFVMVRFWQADRYYYLGYNFDRTQNYQAAYTYLQKAVATRPSEPVFRDELTLNNAVLASSIIYQNQQKPSQQNLAIAKQLIDSAVSNSNRLYQEHPNNIVFIKTRVRVFYTLSQVDPSYLPIALDAIKKAAVLAPTDADISYNLGVLLGQNGDIKGGIKELENTVKLKSNYQGGNAYYALGIFYHQLALDKSGKIVNRDYAQKAIDQMNMLIKTFGPNQQAQDALNIWEKQ